MRVVLGVSTVLGVVGVVSAFGLFYVAERVFHIDRQHIQTMMYLKLSVAGHLTIFLTRTRGPFWSIRPARILWGAVLGTQALATCIALFGFGLVTPLAWSWALMVWGWALASFLLTDPIKLLTYRVLDHFGDRDEPAVGSKPRVDPAAVSPASVSPAAVYKGAFPVGSAQADTQPKPVPAAELKGDKAEAVPAISQKPSAGSDPAPQLATSCRARTLRTRRTADIKERKFWKQYRHAYEECLSATSTDDSPWFVVPADDKDNARLIVSQIVVETLEALGMSYPTVTAERAEQLQAIRAELVG